MANCRVTFIPDHKTVDVTEGVTVAEAARDAEVFINNFCGGEGVCGKCRVQVAKGEIALDEQATRFFSAQEIGEGFILACQARVHGDLEILIPPESRIDESRIMTGGTGEKFGQERSVPLVRKLFLELPPPSPDDNITDVERVSRAIRKRIGWHSFDLSLSCLQRLSDLLRESKWNITVTIAKDRGFYRIVKVEPGDTSARGYGLAVDVGTTTLVAQLLNVSTGAVMGVEGCLNFQARFGEDVISRIIYSCGKGGLAPVHQAVIDNINELVEKLIADKDIGREEIDALVAAGNTTMTHFLLGLTPCSIRLDPYVPTTAEYPQVLAKDLGIYINDSGIVEVIPSVASYVGGDIVAGIVSCGIPDQSQVKGLIDIGTNGEIAIGNSEWLVCCSASAGPAFEGGGTNCGMRATRGAIEKITISQGRLNYQTVGRAKAKGICGSGLIDCIYELVKNGIIGADGKFEVAIDDPRFNPNDDIPSYTIAYPEETETGKAIVVSESDIDNLIKSKGAVFAAIKTLCDYIGLEFAQIETFYVAGGFGSFLDISKAIAIGLLPDIPVERIQFIGNSSLTGARMSLLSEECFEKCLNVARSMTNIELSNHQPFMDEYIASLFLPHTNLKLFPSVDY
jgi:uncharacterized 2Fe-2S/4Fe-4S cluster protein (DUF4445 family)